MPWVKQARASWTMHLLIWTWSLIFCICAKHNVWIQSSEDIVRKKIKCAKNLRSEFVSVTEMFRFYGKDEGVEPPQMKKETRLNVNHSCQHAVWLLGDWKLEGQRCTTGFEETEWGAWAALSGFLPARSVYHCSDISHTQTKALVLSARLQAVRQYVPVCL